MLASPGEHHQHSSPRDDGGTAVPIGSSAQGKRLVWRLFPQGHLSCCVPGRVGAAGRGTLWSYQAGAAPGGPSSPFSPPRPCIQLAYMLLQARVARAP